jgi:two-component system sensor histidine kinase UhpB
MSLRYRLMGLVTLGLGISLALGGAIACWNASRSVRTEMQAALTVGEQTVRNAIEGLSRSDRPEQDLRHLVATFDGDRHLRAQLFRAGNGGNLAAPRLVAASFVSASPGPVPEWFIRLLGAAPTGTRIPLAPANDFPGGAIVLETDPDNEAREVWSEFRDALLILLLFCAQTIVLMDWSLRQTALRPLIALSAALRRIGEGDYRARVAIAGPAEITRLGESFNGMADRLANAEARNHRLHEQLLTLQEEERTALARDLHDEVGPFLFAVNVDAAGIAKLADQGRSGEIRDLVGSIRDSVGHMQKHVKVMLGRLRPAGLAEVGLVQAIENLMAFWRLRHPEIRLELDLRASAGSFGHALDTAIYRVVQEGVTNAVRHGCPSRIDVVLSEAEDRDELMVSVLDDGTGMPESEAGRSSAGFGLIGMRERVAGVGGSLAVSNRAGGGLAVVARWPRRERVEALAPEERVAVK